VEVGGGRMEGGGQDGAAKRVFRGVGVVA
jgi:hypothetical protein